MTGCDRGSGDTSSFACTRVSCLNVPGLSTVSKTSDHMSRWMQPVHLLFLRLIGNWRLMLTGEDGVKAMDLEIGGGGGSRIQNLRINGS